MSPNQVIEQAKSKFQQALSHFEEELKKVRTGRAHPNMLDGLTVEAYGASVPLVQVATVTTPEGQLLQITPFDPANLQPIVSAIRDNPSLGLNPMDDGRVVRIQIPALNEERRREYVKVVGGKTEECMVSLRGARHEANKSLEDAKKARTIGEDEATRAEKQVDDALAQTKARAEAAAAAKEAEIMKL